MQKLNTQLHHSDREAKRRDVTRNVNVLGGRAAPATEAEPQAITDATIAAGVLLYDVRQMSDALPSARAAAIAPPIC